MASQVGAVSGYDLNYPWKNQDKERDGEREGQREAGKTVGGYYINAAQGGEARGVWHGRGAEALGLADGSEVKRAAYDKVYSQIHPQTGEKLGQAPRNTKGSKERYEFHLARYLAAEPQAAGARLRFLERLAHQDARTPALYTDSTVKISKSLSVFHASIRENERRGRLAEDARTEGFWRDAEQRYQAVLQAANAKMIEYAQEWVGTRSGYFGTKVDGVEQGRYESAGLIVSSWLQGTSRDADPHDHIHNLFARITITDSDGRVRALDTMGLRNALPAMEGIFNTHVEAGLTREFGVQWTPRPDGKGNEITGVTREQIEKYSSRAETIDAKIAELAESFKARTGRQPTQSEVNRLHDLAWDVTREKKDPGVIDWDEQARLWDKKLGGELAGIAPRISRLAGPGQAAADSASEVTQMDAQARAQVIREALERTQEKEAAWTRAALIKQMAVVLPPEARPQDSEAAAALLGELADDALTGRVQQVARLDAPSAVNLPRSLVRDLDGRSVYTRPGTDKYATNVQLAMEERLLADAQARTGMQFTREEAARWLGADADALEAQLTERARDASAKEILASGLRMDQAAGLYHMLTTGRTGEVMLGAAGAGKTKVITEGGRIWEAAGKGRAVVVTPTQTARDVLVAAGFERENAMNSAVALGHTIEQRGGAGVKIQSDASAIFIDEATMMSMPDMADLFSLARDQGCKVFVVGGDGQLTAVENGGALELLARQTGYVQLAEAVRFRAEWEREASIRLKDGDASVLEEYDARGRIIGREPEEALEEGRRMYVASLLEDKDTLLMAQSNDMCRELSRRIRDDLIHLGKVDASREIDLREGAKASVGDFITVRENVRSVEPAPGRTIANHDQLRIEGISEDGKDVTVRLAVDCDRETGAKRWAEETFTWKNFAADADLAYAQTGHAGQGRTVFTGLGMVTGSEVRQWLYPVLTRGTDGNWAIVFTQPQQVADPQPGTRAAPELDRFERIQAERGGEPLPAAEGTKPPDPREGVGVLSDVVERDGSALSATETQARNLANADHLAVLGAQWDDQAGKLRDARYAQLVRDALGEEFREKAEKDLAGSHGTWLRLDLRKAEAAGVPAREVVERAVAQGGLGDAHNLAAVLHHRMGSEVGTLVPRAAIPYREQVPEAEDPEKAAYLAELAEAMDKRTERIGEHAAEVQPVWARQALGAVPEDDPVARLDWEKRASDVAAYRERYGFDSETDAIGPEPTGDAPEMRAAWHRAFAAVGPAEGVDLRGAPDGQLLRMRSTYEAETSWWPRDVTSELRHVRLGSVNAHVEAVRAQAEVAAARARGDEEVASRHEAAAKSWAAMKNAYAKHEETLVPLDEDRKAAEQTTEASRHLIVAADSEYRHRHPEEQLAPLRSAEPARVSDEERSELDKDPRAEDYVQPAWITEIQARRGAVHERLDAQKNVLVPDEDPDYGAEGEAWPEVAGREKEAILQPPKPELGPSEVVAGKVAERADAEAGG